MSCGDAEDMRETREIAMAEQPTSTATTELAPTAKILKCFSGSFMAGTIAMLAYRLTLSIATTFANKPVVSDNQTVINLSLGGAHPGRGHSGPGHWRFWDGRSGVIFARHSAIHSTAIPSPLC
jgi:hypothetical protein